MEETTGREIKAYIGVSVCIHVCEFMIYLKKGLLQWENCTVQHYQQLYDREKATYQNISKFQTPMRGKCLMILGKTSLRKQGHS
jgi:hypothetical protein